MLFLILVSYAQLKLSFIYFSSVLNKLVKLEVIQINKAI